MIENVYKFTSHANFYIINEPHRITMIDSGIAADRDDIIELFRERNIDPYSIKDILLTHHDIDHVGNAALISNMSGAPVWISPADELYLMKKINRPGIKHEKEQQFPYDIPKDIRTYDENHEFSIPLKIIPAPGHTPGHVMIRYNKFLFIGDIFRINDDGNASLLDSRFNQDDDLIREQIKKVSRMDVEWIMPGHGHPIEFNKIDWKTLIKG